MCECCNDRPLVEVQGCLSFQVCSHVCCCFSTKICTYLCDSVCMQSTYLCLFVCVSMLPCPGLSHCFLFRVPLPCPLFLPFSVSRLMLLSFPIPCTFILFCVLFVSLFSSVSSSVFSFLLPCLVLYHLFPVPFSSLSFPFVCLFCKNCGIQSSKCALFYCYLWLHSIFQEILVFTCSIKFCRNSHSGPSILTVDGS